ncbi:uncharacterized protein LOC113649215 isoform X1 [Tachysurus fulvidraco]|uniref:uncharacterized protein LOC113649215 isoform X1 n=1 Tax=Tachysurus fulvidraco TaxID=1234273 RepID=UPI001FEE8DFF|nr:uncharacterized protein LOC113649215 isoform X1 [Tachysurus fulvidraco]
MGESKSLMLCNEEMLQLTSDSDLNFKVLNAIDFLEKKYTPQGTYAKYSLDAYKHMPVHTLNVEGKDILFLVDSGAGNSVIKLHELSEMPEMSGRSLNSVGASGIIVKEKFTAPLRCVENNQQSFTFSFLLSECCPINLMGRDLICKLGINLISTPNGLKVCRSQIGEFQGVKWDPRPLLYVYEWELSTSSVNSVNQALLDKAYDVTNPTRTQYMNTHDLHCTAHTHTGPDVVYEQEWFEMQPKADVLLLTKLYWDNYRCTAEVNLSSINVKPGKAHPFTIENSHPHVSLSKGETEKWEDLGMWTLKCVKADDWKPSSDPTVLYSEKTKSYCMHLNWIAFVDRTVEIMPQADTDVLKTMWQMTHISGEDPRLQAVPRELWATGKYDVGLIKNCSPVQITPKSDYRPCKTQYPLKPEAIRGITPVFNSLLESGVIVPCETSPVRTPIFPVRKPRPLGDPEEWRFVQDLQVVNDAVIPRAPNVPNPHTILSQIPPESKWFSVVDLANAFFSVPVHPDSQFWFAFSFNGKPYTFTRLCQGFCESPTIYNEALKNSLESLTLTPGSAILQYMDDCMIAAPSKEQCEKDTIALLCHLAEEGHKASLSKLQFVKQQVKFLGHLISEQGKTIEQNRVAAIQNIPKPNTKKQLMSFLGMCSYCRTFIPNYAVLEAPLSAIAHGKGLQAHSALTWTPEAEKAFVDLKMALQTTPTLGIPDPNELFVQTVDEKSGCMTSVLLQNHGGKMRPVAYFSAKLDPVAAGLPMCLRAVAAAEKAVNASRDIVGYSELTLLVPHAVSLLLLEQKTAHMFAARWLRYHTILLDMPNVKVKRCTVLNPATLLPTEADGEPHNCVAVVNEICSPRSDLQETPLQNPDLEFFVDGSAFRDQKTGRNCVGYAVVTQHETIKAESLPEHLSAQAAELVALTTACRLARDKTVTIYTDSRYAFGVVHDFGTLWKNRGFLTSSGKAITHNGLISELLDAILLPKSIAICKCEAHTGKHDPISQGNAQADAAAKSAAQKLIFSSETDETLCMLQICTPTADLKDLQSQSTAQERATWRKAGGVVRDGVWYGPDDKPCLPKKLFQFYAKLAHGQDHASKGGMYNSVSRYWHTKGFANYSQKFCEKCIVCATNNIGRGIKVSQSAHPPPQRPFEHLQMDFIELTPSEGKKYCLVIVDMFSKWVEAFPTSKQDASAVAKALLSEIIPRWGIPDKISSDNGTPFVNQALRRVGEYLGIDLRQHCAYHPASGGAVERENAGEGSTA